MKLHIIWIDNIHRNVELVALAIFGDKFFWIHRSSSELHKHSSSLPLLADIVEISDGFNLVIPRRPVANVKQNVPVTYYIFQQLLRAKFVVESQHANIRV